MPVLLRDVRDARPTLVLAGARDPVAPAGWRAEAARLLTDGHAVTVPGAAHNVVTTAPGPVARAIRDLLTPDDEELTSCVSETPRSGPLAAGSAAS
ncbi:alpha/beta fold hydrolase [Micromonospora schwarzwaldensis]|uniref:alpha/beta fold hydrolase n=1 Tax=Micromonospora sp. DSM 45708 TaxID=3111767 RepID=UPI0031E3E6DE